MDRLHKFTIIPTNGSKICTGFRESRGITVPVWEKKLNPWQEQMFVISARDTRQAADIIYVMLKGPDPDLNLWESHTDTNITERIVFTLPESAAIAAEYTDGGFTIVHMSEVDYSSYHNFICFNNIKLSEKNTYMIDMDIYIDGELLCTTIESVSLNEDDVIELLRIALKTTYKDKFMRSLLVRFFHTKEKIIRAKYLNYLSAYAHAVKQESSPNPPAVANESSSETPTQKKTASDTKKKTSTKKTKPGNNKK